MAVGRKDRRAGSVAAKSWKRHQEAPSALCDIAKSWGFTDHRQVSSVLQNVKQSPVQLAAPPSPGSLGLTGQALMKSRPPAAAATVPLLSKHCTAHFIYPPGPGRRPRHKHAERPAQLPSTESPHNKQGSGSNERNSATPRNAKH